MGLLTLTFLALTCVSLPGEHTYAGVCKYKLYYIGLLDLGYFELKWERSNKLRPFVLKAGCDMGKVGVRKW